MSFMCERADMIALKSCGKFKLEYVNSFILRVNECVIFYPNKFWDTRDGSRGNYAHALKTCRRLFPEVKV